MQAASPIKTFKQGSYSQIIQQHTGQSFLLIFWSLDCPSCFQELEVISQLPEAVQKKIVLISTNDDELKQDIINTITEFNLTQIDIWLFEQENAHYLRQQVDPTWHGELPKAYYFNSDHQRQILTGVLAIGELKEKL